MGIWSKRSAAGVVGAIAVLTGGVSSGQVGEPLGRYVVHSHGQARALTLDPTRIAVFVEGVPGAERALELDPEIARAMSDAGLDPQRAQAWPIEGWRLAPLDTTARTVAGVEHAVDLLAARAGVGAGPRLAFVSPVFIDDLGGPMFVTPQLLVGFAPGLDDEAARRVLAEIGAGEVVEQNWAGMPGAYRVRPASASGADVLDIAGALAIRADVAWAEPDMAFTGRAELTPNDPGYASCWGLNNTGQFGGIADMDMDAPEAWNTTTGDPSIITLIIDTGVDPAHADINQIGGIDTTSQTGNGEPLNSFDNHGTAVAGCVAAIINNATGTVGMAPATRVSSARAFISINSSGNWTSEASWTVDALAYGEFIGARVSNNSNGYGFTSASIDAKYSMTRSAGMVHFASAGNESQPMSSYPAVISSVNSVSALDVDGGPASFTNTGPSIAFAAPGVGVYTTDRTGSPGWTSGSYVFASGTSFASPYTAGVAALILSVRPSLTAADVEQVLRISSVDLGDAGRDDIYGYGFVNAGNAMTVLAGEPFAFDLTLPLNGAPSAPVTPQLDWSSSLLADSFHLVVDDDPGLTSPVVDLMLDGSISFYNVPAGVLAYSTTYYWGVTAINTTGPTASSPATFTFTTAPPPPPAAFALTTPGNGSADVPTGPTFAWTTSANAASYRVVVANNVLLGAPVIDQVVGAPATTLPVADATLAPSTTYFWRVTAMGGGGSKVGSPTLASFTTAAPPPSCAADLTGDGNTSVLDFAIFASNFGRLDLPPGTGGDLDGDGDADIFDFALFAQDFGCVTP